MFLFMFVVVLLITTNKTQDCGRRDDRWRIMFGRVAQWEQWPWVVHIKASAVGGSITCGGAMIDDQTILTAAHCVPPRAVGRYHFTITVGNTKWKNEKDMYKYYVTSERPITSYSHSFNGDDIMILKLHKKVRGATPICLPEVGEEFPPGSKCYLAGWGETERGVPADEQRFVDVAVLSNEECAAARSPDKITPSQLCAGGQTRSNSCKGDSGGPLMCQRAGGGPWVIAGIVSYGDTDCGDVGRPSVYTRVTSFLDWIDANRH